jgi:integrase
VIRDGKTVESANFATKREAKAFDADRRMRVRRGDWIDPAAGRVTLDSVAAAWFLARRGQAARTQDTEVSVYRRLVSPSLGHRQVGDISSADVSSWMGGLAASGVARSSVRRALAVVRGVLARAVEDRRIVTSPAVAVKAPMGGARREGRALDADELAVLLAAFDDPDHRLVVAMLALGGLRFSELSALGVVDVMTTPYGLGLRVHRARTQENGGGRAILSETKTHRARLVPVPSALTAWVRARQVLADREAPLFVTSSGGYWTLTNFRNRSHWTVIVAKAGFGGLRVHDLRHTAATLMLAGGGDLKSVASVLGHASMTMTADLYGHRVDRSVFQASAGLPADLGLTAIPPTREEVADSQGR